MGFISKEFMSSPYYLAWIRIVGAGFVVFAGIAFYAVIHLVRR
jgi:hypothetical protein